MLKAVSKAEWGAAVAAGKLHRAEMVWGYGASCHWTKDGKVLAAKKPGPICVSYYLADDAPQSILVRVPA
jgi:hypothetical protein